MENALKEMQEDITFNHIGYMRRFSMFTWRIRFRLFFAATIYAAFQYWGNIFAMAMGRLERVYKKYKKRWIIKYNPQCMVYESAL